MFVPDVTQSKALLRRSLEGIINYNCRRRAGGGAVGFISRLAGTMRSGIQFDDDTGGRRVSDTATVAVLHPASCILTLKPKNLNTTGCMSAGV